MLLAIYSDDHTTATAVGGERLDPTLVRAEAALGTVDQRDARDNLRPANHPTAAKHARYGMYAVTT
jgi:hypothetical protein